MTNTNIADIRSSLESFSGEISKEYYLYGAGYKPVLNLGDIYSKYLFLFTEESVKTIKDSIIRCKNESERKRLKMLLEAVYSETFSQSTKLLREKLSRIESSGKFNTPNGETISFINSYNILWNANSREKREEISFGRSKYIDENINPLLEEIFNEEEEFIKSMGFTDKILMYQDFYGINLRQLNIIMKELIMKTEEPYLRLLEYFTNKKLGIGIEGLKRHDILYLIRAHEFDSIFHADKIYKIVSDFIGKSGIDFYGKGRIHFDIEKRDTKSSRAFCSPVKIPEEVYLVINPRGGLDDYSSFLHELGHALHFAHIDENLEVEYRWFGDNSVTEGFAMTFDHLLLDENWLLTYVCPKPEDLKDYLRLACFKELAMLRRCAAKLEYEIKLNDGKGLNGKKEIYAETLNRLTMIKHDKEEFLYDVDPFFYVASYLRAWMFQSSLQAFLRGKFGNNWFLSTEAGKILKEMWSFGQKYPADELMAKFSLGDLSITPLLNQMNNLLN